MQQKLHDHDENKYKYSPTDD